MESDAFLDGGTIPKRHGYKNGNHSPPLRVGSVPEGAKSLALVMDDPDAMGAVGKIWVHWVMWNIPPEVSQVAEGETPAGCLQGTNDFGERGYGGPAPPDREHTYVFKLYALDCMLDCKEGSTKAQLEDAMGSHVIASGLLRGRYAPQT